MNVNAPKMGDMQDADEFTENCRQADRTHGWKVLAGGVIATVVGVIAIASRPRGSWPMRGIQVLAVGVLALIVGAIMVYTHRRHRLPKARQVVPRRRDREP